MNFQYIQKYSRNERILRSIERELEIKESLFLLLLQKREEAAINYAVVKPSIKVIDSARSSSILRVQLNLLYILLQFYFSLLPTIFIYILFYFDDKIHTQDDLIS